MARLAASAAALRRETIQRSSMRRAAPSVAGQAGGLSYIEEAGGVPDFVGEGAGAFHALFGEDDIGAGGGALEERHADGVGAVLLGDHQRVDHVALGLGHLLAVGVAHQAVDVDRLEGDLAHEFAGRA